MWLTQLALANFRNYSRLGLDVPPGVLVFCGQNGQGKTNLLEAVYVLATTRSPRTSAERELMTWPDRMDPALLVPGLPTFTRLQGRAQRAEGEVHLDLVFKVEAAPDEGPLAAAEPGSRLVRSIKVNGLATRAAGLIGQLTVVSFAPEDVSLAGGPPAGRRRYLDLANSQVAPLYLRGLQQYNRVLAQRNQVLRQVRERRQRPAALDPWTDQMIRTGAFLLRHRLRMLAAVSERAGAIFHELAGTSQRLRVAYRSTAGDLDGGADAREIAHAYRVRQEALATREVEQAVSLVGPHRDDFDFMLEDVDLNVYGSRGQQRLAVLALKLAEADWMFAETGELPVVLLDDVLSELDPEKRRYVLGRVARGDEHTRQPGRWQVWITATDTDAFPPDLLEAAVRFKIDGGTVRPA